MLKLYCISIPMLLNTINRFGIQIIVFFAKCTISDFIYHKYNTISFILTKKAYKKVN